MARIARISLTELGHFIFSATSGENKSVEDMLQTDFKEFHIAGHNLGVSQITCVEKFASVCDQLLQHPEFLLAHRSFLVNMNYIRRISEIKRLYLAFQMEESI